MHKASIGIYQRDAKYDDNGSCPLVPDTVFEAAKRVIDSKGQEVLKTKDGFFIISYSENGPFVDAKLKNWLPVQVIRIKQWISGGIKTEEIEQYNQAENNT